MPDWCDKYRVILAFMVVLFLPSLGAAQIILKPFEARYKTEQPGGIVYVSNNILSCNGCNATNQMPPNGTSDNNDFSSKYIDIDGLPETFSSSSADLRLPDCSTITFAGLYWGGAARNNNPRLSQKNQVKLKLPGASNYMDLVADVDFGLFEDQHYQYFKDVTGLVTKNLVTNGTYMVGNVVANEGSAGVEAGWTLVIVYRQDREQVRNLTIFDGFVGIPTDAPDLEIPLNGFLTPPAGPVSYELGFVAYEGDRGLTGDYMQFNKQNIKDATHVSTNTFNSSITRNGSVVTTRNPAHNNTLGYDASILSPDNSTYKYLGNSATSATITMATNADRYAVGVVSTAIDVYNPYFQFTHQYTNLSGTPQVGPGDEVVFEYELSNIGIDQSTNTVFIDSLPAAFQYVPGSLEVQYNGNWTRKTDASQDDDAEFILAGNRVVFRLGTGASATQGGVVGPNTVIKVRYHARLTSDCDLLRCTGSNISKYGQLNYSGNINKENSWQVQSTPQLEAGACATAGPLSIDLNIPLECQAVPENKSFTVDCETDVSMFGLPSGYSVYASSDTGFNTPLSKVSVSGDYIARRVVASGCEYSFNVQVTVNTVKILKQPVSVTTCIDDNIKFNVSALGTGNFFKWQSSENGTTWTDIGGATDSTLLVRVSDVEQNGTRYRVIVNRSCGPSEISQEATLSITQAVKIVRDLQSVDVCEGADTALTVEASGVNISYQWQILSGNTWSNILGENDARLALTGVTAGQSGTKYRALISSTCGTLTSAEAALIVTPKLIITTQPQPLTVCEGSNATFTVGATGDNLSYQWQTNGGGVWSDISGATTSTLSLSSTLAQNGIKYRAVITSTCGTLTSAEAALTVTPKLTITTQPQSVTVCEGSNATFTVNATGDNLSYQWQTNGGGVWSDISGATTSTLTFSSTTSTQNGIKYRAVITSTCGTFTSAEATLTITPKLTITTLPQPLTVCEGSNATFKVGATGDNLSYQWQTNGGGVWSDISDATGSTLNLTSVAAGQSGAKYRAVINSTCGTLTSAEATLTVTPKLIITTKPQPLTVCEGSNAAFTVNATGDNLSYQWQTNGGGMWTDISGATTSTLPLSSTTLAQNGSKYRAVITSTCGTLTSAEAALTVTPKLSITTQPQPVTVCEGSNATFTVGAIGDKLSYQWQTNGGGVWSDISGATGTTLNLTSVVAGHSGTKYRAVITSTCGTLTSAEATLIVTPKLSITTQPQPVTVCEGSNATFTIGATGDNLSYQWQTNGGGAWSDISGATGTTLNLTSVTAGQKGTKYRAVINSTCGTSTSAEATLTVTRAISITSQPKPVAICEGISATFTVGVSGDNATYQWQTNNGGTSWSNITAATGSSFTVKAVSRIQNGYQYRVVVKNDCGIQTSAPAAITVNNKPVISKQPASVTICEGTEAIFAVEASGYQLTYQWQKNDGESSWTNIQGATGRSLTVKALADQNGYYYRVVVSGTCGTVTSEKVFTWAKTDCALPVSEEMKPRITAQPQSLALCVGDPASLSVQASGENIKYQWQSLTGDSWVDMPNETGAELSFPSVTSALNGRRYRVQVYNQHETLTSAEAKLQVNSVPKAVDDAFNGAKGSTLTGSVGENDSDSDQDPLTFTTITPPQHGTWLLDKDGSFTFQPEKDWTGSTTAVYSVSDGKCSTQAEVVFTVLPNLMPPVSNDDSAPDVIQPAARDDVFQTDMEKPVSSSVALNDAIDQIDHPVFSTTSTPINGTLSFSADGSFVYTPNKGFSGVDRFTYQVCSPKGLCSSAKVEIKVIPSTIVNLTPGLSTVHEGGKVSVTATLERPFDEDITIRLSYKGKAIKGSDYHLSDQFETIRIPKGHVTTHDQITIFATVDNQTEEAEDVIIDITSTSNANVRIGTGALVLITNSQSAPPVVSNPADLEVPGGNGIQPQPLVSPNGDNNNDYFQIKNIDSYPNNEVVIFNRWGNEVFRVKGYNVGNGNVFRGLANRGIQIGNNDNLPDGVYYYIVTPDITKVQASADLHKGYLILKRN